MVANDIVGFTVDQTTASGALFLDNGHAADLSAPVDSIVQVVDFLNIAVVVVAVVGATGTAKRVGAGVLAGAALGAVTVGDTGLVGEVIPSVIGITLVGSKSATGVLASQAAHGVVAKIFFQVARVEARAKAELTALVRVTRVTPVEPLILDQAFTQFYLQGRSRSSSHDCGRYRRSGISGSIY